MIQQISFSKFQGIPMFAIACCTFEEPNAKSSDLEPGEPIVFGHAGQGATD